MDEQKDLQNNTSPENESQADPLPHVEVPTIRTYKGDIGHTVVTDKISTAKILLAEQRERAKKQKIALETSIAKPKNAIALIFGIIFGAGAIALIVFFGYTKLLTAPNTVEIANTDFFVFSFDQTKLIDSQLPSEEIYKNVDDIFVEVAGQVKTGYTDIVFYKTDLITEKEARITSAQFFTLYNINIPFDISRAISRDFVYGIYHDQDKTEPFLILGLADYETAFNSMFLWEETLVSDLEPLFSSIQKVLTPPVIEVEGPITNATSTPELESDSATVEQESDSMPVAQESATTTPPEIEETTNTTEIVNRKIDFIDIVYANKDTRTARDKDGIPFFYYSFLERDKILFAQDPALLGEIVRKIKEKQLIR